MKDFCFILATAWLLSNLIAQTQATQPRKTFDNSDLGRISDSTSPIRHRRSKDSKTCQFSPNMDHCLETLTSCCTEKECVWPRKKLKYRKDTHLKITKCTHNLSNWTACCQSCFEISPRNISNNTEICNKFTACKVEYTEVPCRSTDGIEGRAGIGGGQTTASKPAPRTRIIAFSIAGIVMIALLAFAGHSISHTREKVNFQFPNHPDDGELNGHTVLYHQNGSGGAPKYFYHPPNAYPRPNGRLFIGSTLSIIQEEEDVIVADTEVPVMTQQAANHQYPGDHASMTSSSSTYSYSSASGEYSEVVGGAVPHRGLSHFQVQESDDDDGVTHIEIQDLDSVLGVDDEQQYMTSRGPELCSLSSNDDDVGDTNKMERNCVICDVHASPTTSSHTSLPTHHHHHQSNYSLGMMEEMPDYDIASMSMYDVTDTSPVHTHQRRISDDHHFLYVSMPDMTKAAAYIPEIDELLTSSSSRTSGSSSCGSSEYCLNYR